MPTQSIDQVAAAFTLWRSKRSGPRSHTPRKLQKKAVALLAEHSEQIIINTLQIKRDAFKRWVVMQQYEAQPIQAIATPKEKTEFAVLPPAPEPTLNPGQLIIEYPNGIRLHLQGDPSSALLSSVLASLTNLGGSL